jgi:hypothetical protein
MTEKKKQKSKPSPLSKSPYVRRSQEEMELIVSQIGPGSLSIWSACKKYGLNRNTLKLWMTFSAKTDENDHAKPKQSDHLFCWRRFDVDNYSGSRFFA